MNFENFRTEIKSCEICTFIQRHNEPFYFRCKHPEKVKCLIITEQPRKREDQPNFSEVSVINDLQLNNNRRNTIGKIAKIFGTSFTNSIINESGVYYWTHHTKCPSHRSEPSKKCFDKWFKEEKELKLFPNLSTIISIGAVAFNEIVSISDNPNVKSYNYLWKEIEMIVKDKFSKEDLQITIDCNEYTFLALPHPSGVSPLSHLLQKFVPIIIELIKEFDKYE